MKENFANYNQSVALRDLGFDEQTLAGYRSDYNNKLMMPSNKPFINIEDFGYKNYNNQNKHVIKAPLISQVFTFFREKYNLDAWIYTSDRNRYWYSLLKDGRFLVENKGFNTYQEAQTAVIDKLIEIAQKNEK